MVVVRDKAAPKADKQADQHRPARSRPVVERIACWSARHRLIVIGTWLLFVGLAVAIGQVATGQGRPQYDPGQSGQAEQTLHQLGVVTPPLESVLIQARARGATFATDPSMRQAAEAVVTALRRLPSAAEDITSPFGPDGRTTVSADGRSTLVTFRVAGPHSQADTTVGADLAAVAAVQARYPGLLVAEAGSASTDAVGNNLMNSDFHKAEITSVPITLVLLLVVFGALIAAGIPILLAGASVIATISLLAGAAQWLPLGSSTSELVLILGMAVGVDYSLFYLRREREERAAGKSFPEALQIAAATSGRAILVSGLTVMISLAGLFLTGVDLFTGMAYGTIPVVGISVVASLTLLPAVLSLLGEWADRCRIPLLGRRRTAAAPSRLWAGLVRMVVRHPLRWGAVALLALLAIAAPALGMRTGSPPIDLPSSLPSVQTLDAISAAFPGRPAPAQVVITGQDLGRPAVRSALTALEARASATGPLREPVTWSTVAGGRAVIALVPLAGNGSNSASLAAVQTLRDQALPATLGRVDGVSYAVTGSTATASDWTSVLRSRTPIVLAVAAALAFIVLLIAFRSLTLPLISIALNLVSVGAACGLMVLIFQDGNLQGLLGFTSYGGISQWVPLFTFVLLFGLSMDYHVFILSRIRERRAAGATTPDAVIGGIAASAGVVTSAAVIMVAVFSIFATLSFIDVKMLGVGLAFAVLIDATIVRGILVPAAMTVLGERCWYLPRQLSWLPRLMAEAADGMRAFPTTRTWWPRDAQPSPTAVASSAAALAAAPVTRPGGP
jgi:putative drug exporter of the RND superfamily